LHQEQSNGRLAAVRRLAYEASDAGLLSPELAAGIRRVKGVRQLGVRFGNWLNADEARRLWQSPDGETLKGKRDRAILAVLLGCGLRRRELADFHFRSFAEARGALGEHRLDRERRSHWTVPVPDWLKAAIDDWTAAADICTGKVFRCVCRAGKRWGEGVTERLVWARG